MADMKAMDEQDSQVSQLVASAHNHSLNQGMFYARALDVLERKGERLHTMLVAEQSKSLQLGDELVSVREKVTIIEVERDDLRSELCKKRTEIDSINVQVLRLAEALKVADEQVLAKGMLLEMGEQEHAQEVAELKVTIDLLTLPKAVDEFEMTPEKATPDSMAALSGVLDKLVLGTAEEERERAKAWMSTAAQHCRNEEYWRRRAEEDEKIKGVVVGEAKFLSEYQASRAEYQSTPEQAAALEADQAEEAGTRG